MPVRHGDKLSPSNGARRRAKKLQIWTLEAGRTEDSLLPLDFFVSVWARRLKAVVGCVGVMGTLLCEFSRDRHVFVAFFFCPPMSPRLSRAPVHPPPFRVCLAHFRTLTFGLV